MPCCEIATKREAPRNAHEDSEGEVVNDLHAAFRQTVAASRLVDPMPTFVNLGEATGVPVDDLVHHALVRWASAGAEALMALEPQVFSDLRAARDREDWRAVAGIIDWLTAGAGGEEGNESVASPK